MKKGFTIIEVSILFVIFLIVAFLVVPLSLDDTIQATNISRWRAVQSDFQTIFYTIGSQKNSDKDFKINFTALINKELKYELLKPYHTSFLNGNTTSPEYNFDKFYITRENAVLAVKFLDDEGESKGILMYDVNGTKAPNTWGKDIFGINMYTNKYEPLGKNETFAQQKADCSKNGSGLYCSNYYLLGGNFD